MYVFMYVDILPSIVATIYQFPLECHRLQYIMSVFETGVKLCQVDVQYVCIDLCMYVCIDLCMDLCMDLYICMYMRSMLWTVCICV
jgi:hypothetical protein